MNGRLKMKRIVMKKLGNSSGTRIPKSVMDFLEVQMYDQLLLSTEEVKEKTFNF